MSLSSKNSFVFSLSFQTDYAVVAATAIVRGKGIFSHIWACREMDSLTS